MVQKRFPAECRDFVEHSYPTATFPRVAGCVPQVGELCRGGCADVGAVTCVLVTEGGGTRGCAWCPPVLRLRLLVTVTA